MVGDGRSTAGKKLQNDVPVDLWKIKDGGPSKIKTLQINDDKIICELRELSKTDLLDFLYSAKSGRWSRYSTRRRVP